VRRAPLPRTSPRSSKTADPSQEKRAAPTGGPSRSPLYYANVDADFARALVEYDAALRAAPNAADVLTAMAVAEQSQSRWEASLDHLRQAATLDPRSLYTARRLCRVLLWLRRYPEALAYAGRPAAAVREGERGAALMPVTKDARYGTYNEHLLARIYLLAGQPDKALDRLEHLPQHPVLPLFRLAQDRSHLRPPPRQSALQAADRRLLEGGCCEGCACV